MLMFLSAVAGGFPGIALAADSSPSKAPAGTYVLDKAHASVTGKILHVGLSYFTFNFTDFDASYTYDPAQPTKAQVKVSLKPASVRTGVAALDTELAGSKFFNVAQYPDISFSSTSITPGSGNKGVMTGTLTMMGKSKTVSLPVVYHGYATLGSAQKMGFSGTLNVKRSDFGMTALVGPVADDVALAIEVEFALKK
ncbi:YceI family protein [Sphingobium subterraneum]|uniref:Polyisoprenoid-binding protein YceI n=1 Tax=Sphingobium subterraneum TaxID=627688 RepID=A0A841IZ67_9SPHN|nr:YceI family protein [Sphingobium subterraneum]MBB6123422.1 polyisoprenoid-binding protein YceI [Sphingobium subterraneum]